MAAVEKKSCQGARGKAAIARLVIVLLSATGARQAAADGNNDFPTIPRSVSVETGADGAGEGDAGRSGPAIAVSVYGSISTDPVSDAGVLTNMLFHWSTPVVAISSGGVGHHGRNHHGLAGSGGSGGAGGTGGTVTVSLDGVLVSQSLFAEGILATSNGGNGGDGGHGSGIDAHGGSGGEGGNGAAVSVTITSRSSITTTQGDSAGISAMSVGGIGGEGGSFGGVGGNGSSGGKGGDGGTVAVTSNGDILTLGADSHGVSAQSIGGGGGNGGSFGGVGGDGGRGRGGGAGGDVTVTANGQIGTDGDSAYGVFAQSIGGGGGFGGSSAGLAGIGGHGGAAADGGDSSITFAGEIYTLGTDAYGLFAQSVGGGGGAAGSGKGLVGLGGSGASSGDGGKMTLVTAQGSSVTTFGEGAAGAFLQSIGGGGGSGRSGGGLWSSGGSGGGGGDGGEISASLLGTIVTHGNYAEGLLAETVGGGGGHGGSAGGVATFGGSGGDGGAGGAVTISNGATGQGSATILTTGDYASAISAHSFGGGGGSGGNSVSAGPFAVAIGGKGGHGGHGGAIDITNFGVITTAGAGADTIFATSAGGGGGKGGYAVSVGASYGASASVAIGGEGGGGGNGGAVTVDNEGTVAAHGDSSRAIVASSTGGGGGHGGAAISVDVAAGQSAGAVSVGVGGYGGGGGAGGTIVVDNDGSIVTTGASFATGIVAQSVGGGGGTGGLAVAVSASAGANGAASLGTSIGGSGGSGGHASAVTVTNTGDITTLGVSSDAILAQSIGGGGGSGGTAVTGTLALSRQLSASASVAVGGSGGSGGDGGAVTVENTGSISTADILSVGIFAQSIGGGGGRGGHADAFSIDVSRPSSDSESGGKSVSVSVAVGGHGGSGGHGGAVTVTNNGQIETAEGLSAALFAQSIGGGGGAGGHGWSAAAARASPVPPGDDDSSPSDDPDAPMSVAVSVAVGGAGGSGGDGGAVTISGAGTYRTRGAVSPGILVQSVGGGGGIAGSVHAMKYSSAKDADGGQHSLGVELSVGGSDGDGGKGGAVDVTTAGAVWTSGPLSAGVLAQSIGGGGGVAGHADNVSVEVSANSPSIGLSIGGKAGHGGDGGTVTLDNTGIIVTTGIFSHGLVGQSVGGGGGMAGSVHDNTSPAERGIVSVGSTASNIKKIDVGISVGGTGPAGGDGNAVAVSNEGSIQVTGEGSMGMIAHSVGGGGGIGGQGATTDKISAVVGGRGGGAGDGGSVTASNTSTITTEGAWGAGIVAQSIGGGGGIGGMASDQPAFQIGVGITVGGAGGSSGDGKDVAVDQIGSIATQGDFAAGIIAQSIGGGGGIGGAGSNASLSAGVTVGGHGGNAGHGGTVEVDLGSGSAIGTAGLGAAGIIAQSIGGGGGLAGKALSQACFGIQDLSKCATGSPTGTDPATAASGTGGAITVTGSGTTISTAGDFAHGIVAQSLGGGGGFASDGVDTVMVGAAGGAGTGGDIAISLSVSDLIATSGYHSHGILAQSLGKFSGASTGSGTITIDVEGRIAAAGADSFAIFAESHEQTAITIGEAAIVSGGSGQGAAVRLIHSGSVTNDGTIASLSGTAIESDAEITVVNHGILQGSVVGSTESVVTNMGDYLTGTESVAIANAGIVSPAGTGVVGSTTAILYAQSSLGSLAVDLDFVQDQSDVLIAEQLGAISGAIAPNLLSLGGTGSFQVLTSVNPLPAGAFDNLAVTDTAAVTYALTTTSNGVAVSIANVDFAQPGLTSDQLGVAAQFNQAYASTDMGDLAQPITQAANAPTLSALASELEQIHPGAHAAASTATQQSASAATGNLLSCGERDGSFAAIREGECVWAKATARWLEHDDTSHSRAFEDTSYGFAGGAQVALAEHWRFGYSLGYEASALESGANLRTDVDRLYAGTAVKYTAGPVLLAATLAYTHGLGSSDRTIATTSNGTLKASGDPDSSTVSTRLRAAYLFEFGAAFLRPQIDVDFAYSRLHAFSEHGADSYDLIFDTQDTHSLAVTPTLEIGTSLLLESGRLVRPFIEAGVVFASTDADVEATLRGAGDGAPSLTGSNSGEEVYARLAAGISIFETTDREIKFRYEGLLGDDTRSHGASIKMGWAY